jgi:hypothetical protein
MELRILAGVAGIACWVDVDRADQAVVFAQPQIRTRNEVGVVEAKPRRSRSERQSAHPVLRDVRGAFLGGSVDIDGQRLAMPVKLFGSVGVVVDIDYYGFTFGEPQ